MFIKGGGGGGGRGDGAVANYLSKNTSFIDYRPGTLCYCYIAFQIQANHIL